MSNFSAALIDAGSSSLVTVHSDINAVINQYTTRYGVPYFSPSYVMTVGNGPFGVPYHMQGLAMQTCNNMYISAPEAYHKSTIYHSAKTLHTAGQYVIGQAPTAGVYTGVEDHCQ